MRASEEERIMGEGAVVLVDGSRCGLRVSQEAMYHLHVANNEIMQGRCEASSVAHCENGLSSVR